MTDAEVIQELLHRYLALRIWPQGRESVREFAALMQGRIEPMYAGDVQQAARLADEHRDLSARDLVHAAVMSRLGVRQIVSADAGFDRIGAIERLDPALVDGWGASLPV